MLQARHRQLLSSEALCNHPMIFVTKSLLAERGLVGASYHTPVAFAVASPITSICVEPIS